MANPRMLNDDNTKEEANVLLTAPSPAASAEIGRDPAIRGGAPVLAGTRIAIHDIVAYARVYEWDVERIHHDALPHLSKEDIRTALRYYQANRKEIDGILHDQEAEYDRRQQAAPR
jgi:uncharacterized protein (DUF433 family)